jgi:hypothetical protein
MTRYLPSITGAIVGATLLGVVPARAIELTPGTWQETETGTENSTPLPTTTDTSCITPEEAKDPLNWLSPEKDLKEMKGQCKMLDVKQSTNSFSIRLQCGDPKQFTMNLSVDYTLADARSCSGTVKSTVTTMGKTKTTDRKIEGKWIAAGCKKK